MEKVLGELSTKSRSRKWSTYGHFRVNHVEDEGGAVGASCKEARHILRKVEVFIAGDKNVVRVEEGDELGEILEGVLFDC